MLHRHSCGCFRKVNRTHAVTIRIPEGSKQEFCFGDQPVVLVFFRTGYGHFHQLTRFTGLSQPLFEESRIQQNLAILCSVLRAIKQGIGKKLSGIAKVLLLLFAQGNVVEGYGQVHGRGIGGCKAAQFFK